MAMDDTNPPPRPNLKELREAIPKHCFEPSASISTGYIIRDAVLVLLLAGSTIWIPLVPWLAVRCLLWAAYGFLQGLFFTGLWILAHECGHGALFASDTINDTIGFTLHSFLLVPYFSWKYSHSKHHRYANHMGKDTAFVPRRKGEFRAFDHLQQVLELGEDIPVLNLAFLLVHQLLGWPLYLLFGITAGDEVIGDSRANLTTQRSHFNPTSGFFESRQAGKVLLSDLGLLLMVFGLVHVGRTASWTHVFLLYGVPYLWVNHWLVAVTFLHHNHISAKHYEPKAWTFQDGALSTVDREFGWIGRSLFHGIIEHHVIHHLFPRVPFYHAEEATEVIARMLGKAYLRDDTPFWQSLWTTFRSLQYVKALEGAEGVLVWHVSD